MATAGGRATRKSAHRCAGEIRRDLTVRVVHRDGVSAAVEIVGEIDVQTVGELRTILLALADDGCLHLVADFSAVRFCDAAGLGALVAVNNRIADGGGALRLVGVRPPQRRIFQITRLDRLFRLYDGVDDALTT